MTNLKPFESGYVEDQNSIEIKKQRRFFEFLPIGSFDNYRLELCDIFNFLT